MSADVQRRPVQRPPNGPVLWIVCAVLSAVLSFAASLAVGTVIEWVGMHTWWADEGVRHSQDMVPEDLGYLAEYRRSLLTEDTVAFAARWADVATQLADAVGVLRLIRKGIDAPAPREPAPWTHHLPASLQRLGQQLDPPVLLRSAVPYLLAMVYVWQDAFIRLAVVYLALPAFAIALVLGLIDGLGRRDIRRWCGGRESSFIYHKAKRLLWPAFSLGFFLYLTWPSGGFNPAWIVLPFCAALATTVSLSAGAFKKYL